MKFENKCIPFDLMIITEDINTVSEYYEPHTTNAVSQPVSTDTSFVIMLSTFMNDHHMFTVMFITAPYPLGLGAVQWAGSPHTQQDKTNQNVTATSK